MMKLRFFFILLLLPFFVQSQIVDDTEDHAVIKTTLTFPSGKKKTALKSWMYHYLYPQNRQTVPFQNPYPNQFQVPAGSYHTIESRNALHNEQLSPYLNKVYQHQVHHQTVNTLRQFSDQTMSFAVPQNLINRALSAFILKMR